MADLTGTKSWCKIRINYIGQFVTILSVNKTRDFDGRNAPFFFLLGAVWNCAHFLL